MKTFNNEFSVRTKSIGLYHSPYVIAEMACAHDGDIIKAKALIDAVAEAGFDAVQLQIFHPEHQVTPGHEVYDFLATWAFSAVEWSEIVSYARRYDIAISGFLYDMPSLELALKLGIDCIKLSSADLSNPEMLEASARSKLPITLGTGASTLDEIGNALQCIGKASGEKVVLMHGVQNFPTTISTANIRRIQMLQRVFQLPVGYQDHTEAELDISKAIDLVAVGMGACIIEKHITLDRSEKGADYQAALEPDEVKMFVKYIRDASIALGPRCSQSLNQSDLTYRQFQKKSIVAAELLPEGTKITREKVEFLRTSTSIGLYPSELPQLLGNKTRRDIEKFEQIQFTDLVY